MRHRDPSCTTVVAGCARPRRKPIATLALVASLACLGVVSSSSAAIAHHPTGIYAPFADCPLGGSSAEICIAAREVGGEFVVGRKVVPFDTPLTIQGGFFDSEGSEELTFVGAEDGTRCRSPR